MEEAEESLIQQHIQQDEELKRYWEDHRKLEAELEDFNKRIYLTPEEEMEKKNLQKKKLLGKEKIYKILEKYRKM
ncbi:MAG: DUF465 domain-containing protein [Deltaproteobacteria bacterium]|nr:DUF465 domain-containing protein [Deltaproteobacteria bacterium]